MPDTLPPLAVKVCVGACARRRAGVGRLWLIGELMCVGRVVRVGELQGGKRQIGDWLFDYFLAK